MLKKPSEKLQTIVMAGFFLISIWGILFNIQNADWIVSDGIIYNHKQVIFITFWAFFPSFEC